MIKLPHLRIARFTPTKIGTNITLEILQEDLSREVRDDLERLWKDGTSLAGGLQEAVEQGQENSTEEESIASLVSKLHYLMGKYCEKEGMNFEAYNKDFKSRNKVDHKNLLSRETLKQEIERHKAGLL